MLSLNFMPFQHVFFSSAYSNWWEFSLDVTPTTSYSMLCLLCLAGWLVQLIWVCFFCWLLIGWIIGWLVVGSLVIGWVVGSSLVVG